MAKKVSKWFRVGVEGDTCDGRVIDANDIQNMADTFDPRVYGCRIKLEHLKGFLPDSPFRRYGDVVELKAEAMMILCSTASWRCSPKSPRPMNWWR